MRGFDAINGRILPPMAQVNADKIESVQICVTHGYLPVERL